MYARVELVIDRHPKAILVPGEALAGEGDDVAVWTVGQGGVVGKRKVKTGATEGTLVEVTKGLEGGESVIVEGRELVREGQKVRAEARSGAR